MSSYYSKRNTEFLKQDNLSIFGEIASNDAYDTVNSQKNAWLKQIEILKSELVNFQDGNIIFEYSIPRVGGRIDNVFLYKGLVFILEFKVFSAEYLSSAIVQTRSYALDLSSFHKESHNRIIVPILIATNADNEGGGTDFYRGKVHEVYLTNGTGIARIIKNISERYASEDNLNAEEWINSSYQPTPTIIEAAEVLYKNHSVENITQNDAAENLNATSKAISEIIASSKLNRKKSICFITGVPGAGKTLAGLNIAIENQKKTGEDYACFLTGNKPLVEVLTEALARDEQQRSGIRIGESREKVKSFIQIIHRFRDTALMDMERPPVDHVVIFDEAQRAWHSAKLSRFMTEKKKEVLGRLTDEQRQQVLSMSEPEVLIDYLNRHNDWAVIVCLVGGGQDINDGEAGIGEWFNSLMRSYPNWNIYVSNKMIGAEYVSEEILNNINHTRVPELHLSTSLRSFRSEKVSDLVHAIIDANFQEAKELYKQIEPVYPIAITRDYFKAKEWVKQRAGITTARYGLMATSKAKRLRTDGIWVECSSTPAKWFLSGKDDIKSSFALEEVSTEFDIQGLEIDWGIVGWDADYRYLDGEFTCHDFVGSKWINTRNEYDKRYTKNAYRVLLTRSRQGFIIFVPNGDNTDITRKCEYYDELYKFLKNIGIEEV
jgi:hypothetical protein